MSEVSYLITEGLGFAVKWVLTEGLGIGAATGPQAPTGSLGPTLIPLPGPPALRAVFLTKAFYARAQPAGVFTPQRLTWSSNGGPAEATLTTDATDPAAAFELLRSPVEISLDGEVIWWGYVDSVEAVEGALAVRSGLGPMANRVAARYRSLIQVGETWQYFTFLTDWVENAASVAVYGKKELLLELDVLTPAQADAARDAALLARAWPTASASPRGNTPTTAPLSQSKISNLQSQITLSCKGWYSTLAWQYWYQADGLELYIPIETGEQAVGSTAYHKLAQSFPAGSTYEVLTLAVYAKKVGTPDADLKIGLYSNGAGAPATLLSSYTVAVADVKPDFNWISVEITPTTITDGTTYWLVVESTNHSDSDYYRVRLSANAGAPGAFRIYDGAAWAARSPDAHMIYQVSGARETSLQIADIAAASGCGQFLTGVLIEQASSIEGALWRDWGDTGLQEIQKLLDAGVSGGGALQAEVTRERLLRVYARPTTAEYTFAPSGLQPLFPGAAIRPAFLAGRLARVVLDWLPRAQDGADQTVYIQGVEMDSAGNITVD